ncbi:MAG: patatin family protein, partial [Lachnospiraceae bacterium]|nr:patatin family protein [Lachnospiraceae bacterium]
EQEYEKILVIKTRDLTFRKETKTSSAALRFYRKWPAFARNLSVSTLRYNEECSEIERLHAEGRLFRIAPSRPVEVARVEKDVEKLGALYWHGYQDCLDLLDEMRSYLDAGGET